MTVKQKKLLMLIAGFLAHAAACIIKGLHITDSRFLYLCLTLIQYGGMIAFIFGVNYFGTTYQYEKYPEESAQTVIDQNAPAPSTTWQKQKLSTLLPMC